MSFLHSNSLDETESDGCFALIVFILSVFLCYVTLSNGLCCFFLQCLVVVLTDHTFFPFLMSVSVLQLS